MRCNLTDTVWQIVDKKILSMRSGHGRSAKFNGLTKRQAELSVGASIILVRYLWDIFLLINENK